MKYFRYAIGVIGLPNDHSKDIDKIENGSIKFKDGSSMSIPVLTANTKEELIGMIYDIAEENNERNK